MPGHDRLGHDRLGHDGHDDAEREYGAGGPDNTYFDEGRHLPAGAVPTDADHDEEEYEEDDAPKRYSWKLMAAVIVTGAVVTGGGAVLYNSFKNGADSNGGGAPIIKAGNTPSKTVPTDAGGRQFPHQDSKLLGRLDNNGSSTASEASDTDGGNRIRSVPTVRIGRDGRLILPQAPEAVAAPTEEAGASSAGAAPVVNVPGINVVDTLNGSGGASSVVLPPVVPREEASAEASNGGGQPANEAGNPVQPIIKNRGAGSRTAAANSEPPPVPSKSAVGSAWRMTGAEPPTSGRSQQVAEIRPTIAQPISTAATSASTLGAGPINRSASSGYVAVLATVPTQVQALQNFADLQQKHPNALRDRVPDVQRTDLKSRGLGVMYRLVVGPAGSRNDANELCASLKLQGYKGCWVKSN